jgi:HPt (histidine-containing phosphotransfer) domain-containing protein
MSTALTPEPPNGASPSRAVLDELALSRLRELDPDGRHGVLQRVLSAFEASLVRMLAQLAAERDNGNAGVVSMVVHTLKSSSASVGALHLSKSCADVEWRLRAQLPGDLQGDIETILAAGDSALVAVRAMLRA